jgi:endonuclease YncB( thermonuclease family)
MKVAAVLLVAVNLVAAQTDWSVETPTSAPEKVRDSRRVAMARKASFSCNIRYVTDGDTFRCTDGTRVRLSSIDTPEMPGSCRIGRTCAPGDPFAAKAALERLISGRTVQCEPVGMSYNRVAAWCSVGGIDLSCAMVRGGHAIRLPQFDTARRLCR